MRKSIILGGFLLLFISAFSQTITITDHLHMRPISGVAVYSGKTTTVLYSAADGTLDISEFMAMDSLYFKADGYRLGKWAIASIRDNNFRVTLREMNFDLEDVVISASRFEETKKDVPGQVEIIRSRDIEFMNQASTADVLQTSGKVFVQKSQFGGGSPVIRGFEANRILLVVDGVRMNNAIYRAGHLQNVITLDNANMEKVEIVYGPGSVMYGSDALGGVMHFYTKRPRLSPNGFAASGNGFFRFSTAAIEKSAHVDVNFGWKKFALLSSITLTDLDDVRTGAVRNPFYGNWGERPHYVVRASDKDSMLVNRNPLVLRSTGYSQVDFLQKVLYRPNDRIEHLINFQVSNSSNISRYDRLSEYNSDSSALKFAEWYYGPQNRLLGSYQFNWVANRGFADRLRLTAAYQDIGESRITRRFNSNNRQHRIENVKALSLNLDMDKRIGVHEIRYGAEAIWNIVKSTAFAEDISSGIESNLDTRYPDGGSEMGLFSGFISHSWELSPRFILSDGIRLTYSHLNSKFNDTFFFPFPFREVTQNNPALNGRLGWVYLPSSEWKIYNNFSTGFRAPNVDDMSKVFESTPGSIIVPNPDLKPEYVYSGELGFTGRIREVLSLEGTGFFNWMNNGMVVDQYRFSGQDTIFYDGQLSRVTAMQNKAQSYITGATGIISADITEWFSMSSSLAFTYGRILTDSTTVPLDHIPPVYGRTSAVLSLKGFRAELFAQYNGWKRIADYNPGGEDNQQYATPMGMPAWWTLNLRSSFQLTQFVQLQASCENILDQHYRTFSSGVSAPGRNFIFAIRMHF